LDLGTSHPRSRVSRGEQERFKVFSERKKRSLNLLKGSKELNFDANNMKVDIISQERIEF